jgi:hypothetical protein
LYAHAEHIGLNEFFPAIREHPCDDTLPPTAVVFREDHPKDYARPLPRALCEHVMAQLEYPDNLDR